MDTFKQDLMEKMAENLPLFRKVLKLSQEDLAQILGISRFTVMLYENKRRPMTWSTFLALVCIFEKHPKTAILLDDFGITSDEFYSVITKQKNMGK